MTFDTLVLSGGSTSGIMMLGKMHRLYIEENIMFDKFSVYSGSSIGSVICLLLIIGYTPSEIAYTLYKSTVWEKLLVFNIVRIVRGQGIFCLDLLRKELEVMILRKVPSIPTFEQLPKKFLCCSFNVSNNVLEYFDTYSTPSMSVLDAVIMSCAIPLIFEPVVYNEMRYIDGGIADNFPLLKTVQTFKSEHVLGICCKKACSTISDLTKWKPEDVMSIMFATSCHQTEMQLAAVNQIANVTMVYVTSNVPFYDLTMSQDKVIDMFKSGF